jgi:hypothetical protein
MDHRGSVVGGWLDHRQCGRRLDGPQRQCGRRLDGPQRQCGSIDAGENLVLTNSNPGYPTSIQ